ncbi:helix-turn-helix domain-containing protein [Saliphagus sp. LR7]|uniref:MarR family transcriptional regulator n=1 Tax=Saliphagus sp. LR7 TaxID=2282654 RepID=UPI000DF77DB9|nr:helix-turn-helix domain-containing protein [Saliphagus sp. LR7]
MPEEIEDLPPSCKLVLKVLEYQGELSQTELAEETYLPRRTVRYATRRLMQRRLIDSRNCIGDARSILYSVANEDSNRGG